MPTENKTRLTYIENLRLRTKSEENRPDQINQCRGLTSKQLEQLNNSACCP